MFAVIKTGGKQYSVAAGDMITVMTLDGEPGDAVTFDEVLMLGGDGEPSVGAPTIDGANVSGEIVEQTRGAKVDRLQEAPPAEFQAQARSSPGPDACENHRDRELTALSRYCQNKAAPVAA